MDIIATYKSRVYSTSDKKKLAKGSKKTYQYGAINIRSPQLKEFIGKDVVITIFKSEE